MSDLRPRIGLTLGDPAGIGPEIVHDVVRGGAWRETARLLVLGPGCLRGAEIPLGGDGRDGGEELAWLDTGPERVGWRLGAAQESAGRAALAALRRGAELAAAGALDALVTAPVSKEALHLAGERVEGQTELLARWARAPRVQMLAVARLLRVVPATRHLPLAEALARLPRIDLQGELRGLDDGLRQLGFPAPRLALAGLNPHAGEGGILGREEQELLGPAAASARASGLDVAGPLSPDTVFLRAARGEFDAVLALYHDQAFIPVKLHAPEEGLTVLLGLPYLRVSPAHGTAFDIAGRGLARSANLQVALRQAALWAARRRAQPSPACGSSARSASRA